MLKPSLIISIVIFMTSFTFAQQADEIIGKYHLPNDLDIEIFKKGDQYFGKIIALNNFEDGQTKDVNNPEESRQNDDLVGKVIIENLKFDQEKKQWLNGNMYGPEKGMVFNLKIIEIREHEIEVVGSKFVIWHTLVWKKI